VFRNFDLSKRHTALFAAIVRAQSKVKDLEGALRVLNKEGVGLVQIPHFDSGHVMLTSVVIHESGEMLSSTVSVGPPSALEETRRAVLRALVGLYREPERTAQKPETSGSYGETWTAILSLLAGAGLTASDFRTWASRTNRESMTPEQLDKCFLWLRDRGGLRVISETVTEPA